MGEIKIEFKTITPIWTGDAWGENSELKATAIMGSLRFWFELYCHFAGIEVKEKEELNYKEFIKRRREDLDKKDFEILDEMKISLSSQIFGCTGWRSRIEIREISFIQSKDYFYPIGKQSFSNLKYTKEFYNKRKEKIERKEIIPSWYFPKGFYGTGSIIFKTTEQIKDNILFPLLNFIEQYAFIGAKNNLGYGRVKILKIDNKKIDLNQYSFNLKEFGIKKSIDKNIFQIIKNSNKLNYNKIQICDIKTINRNLSDLIMQLIEKKVNLRKLDKNKYIRHYKFGSTAKDIYKNNRFNIEIKGHNATKIIPLISKNSDNSYSGKFLSIIGIQNIGAKK